MERRRRVANTSNIAVLICQNVGEPPTLHRIQVLQRFQAAFKHRKGSLKKQNHLAFSTTIFY